MAYRSDVDVQGGAALVMLETGRALQALGVHVDVTYELKPDVRGYDLVHIFNIWEPHSALEQVRHLKGTGVPIVWSPFYLHWCEYAWASLAIRYIYDPPRSAVERSLLLKKFTDGTLTLNGLNRWFPNEVYPGFHQHVDEMLASVDHVCAISSYEVQKLAQVTRWIAKPFTVTPHGVDARPFQEASAEAFRKQFGLTDFVLCVGSVDERKNQLLLVEALKGADLPIVLIGPYWSLDYPGLCLREGGSLVTHISRAPREIVASAYKAARVHALPSFAEGAALVNLEAAAAGCALVVSNRSSEFEYFGDAPYYCDPADPTSIRAAVLGAYESRSTETARWEALSRRVGQQFTWQRTAELTLRAYEATLARKAGRQDAHRPAAPSARRSPGPAIHWEGAIFDFSGPARLSREALRTLARREVPLAIQSFARDERFFAQLQADPDEARFWQHRWEQRVTGGTKVLFHPPTLWNGTDVFALNRHSSPGFDRYVGITMFETDRLPTGWAEACNGMDEVWVPSTFNRETFARAGVDPQRLQVIPFGLDARPYDPARVKPLDVPGRRGFTFLSVFQWMRRKGWDVLLRAYLSAFTARDDVCLVLRTHPDRIKTPLRERIDRFVRRLGHDPTRLPSLILLEDSIPDPQMPALYAAADAFVLPTRGEGWGIPFMEAMAMGLPTIATRWSAYLDFMNDDNSYLVDVQGLVPVDPEQTAENPFYTRDQLWAEPSVARTAALMRQVYERRDEARARGARAREDILANWSPDRTADWILARAARPVGGGP